MARKNLLKGFKKPKGITFEHLETNPNYGKFTAYPFETGFGTTVGNTLRRVLLSSIQGYAVTSIRITSYNENGIKQTGWVTNIPGYDDAWFYFNDDGTLLTNSYTPDGFYVDENGIWIPGK